MENQIINNGTVLIEKGNLVHLRNIHGNQMIFECVSIDNGYLVLEPLDFKKFNSNSVLLNQYVTGKPVVKGVIELTKR